MCLLCPSVLSKSTSLFDFRQDQRHTDGSKRFDCPRFWHTWATASVSTHHAGCLSLGRLVPPPVGGEQNRASRGDGWRNVRPTRHHTRGSVLGELPRSCHPILVADRGWGALALFHAWDAWGWDGIIRGKGSTHGAVSPGVWLSASGLGRQKARLAGLGSGSLGSIVGRSGLSMPSCHRG